MFSGPKSRRRCASLALAAGLSLKVATAQQTAPAPDEAIAVPITVRASNSAAQIASDEFLTGFITVAVRFEGPEFASCVATAVTLRPDLAAKIVVSALNISWINGQPPQQTLSCSAISQIVKAAVRAASKNASVVVKAAIKSEPRMRDCIIAAAIAAAPDQEALIRAAVGEMTPMSMLAWWNAGRFNPADNLPLSDVNSPEQPPAGP